MTEEEKKAIWWLEEVVTDKDEYKKTHAWVGSITLDYIETLLNLIQRKDIQIDEISKNPYNELRVNGILFSGTDIKQYFAEQAKEVE